jgi:hypothetical protein
MHGELVQLNPGTLALQRETGEVCIIIQLDAWRYNKYASEDDAVYGVYWALINNTAGRGTRLRKVDDHRLWPLCCRCDQFHATKERCIT